MEKLNITDALTDMLTRAAVADEDWVDEDGILICGNCGEPKETKVNILGTETIVQCMCRCQEDAYIAKEKNFRDSQRKMRAQQLRNDGIRDGRLRECRFDTATDSIYIQKCRQFTEHWDEIREGNTGLLLYGDVGTGKTYAAACIANELLDRGIPVLMTSFPEILNTPKNDISKLAAEAQTYDLVIVDDLGAERDTEYATEVVYYFVDARYRSGKPMIVTTNLTPTDMQNQRDTRFRRIYDRILEMCIPFKMSGGSYRSVRREEKASLLREIINGK